MSSSFSDLAERPLTPTELLQTLNLAGHKGTHRIEGQVVDVHHSEKYTYLTVEGGGNTIKVRVKDRSVPLAATVACEGTVFVNVPKSTVFSGFEVLLSAETCLVLQRAAVVDEVKRKPKVMLDAFVRANNTDLLVWVGTQTGHDDAFAEFKKRFVNARPFWFRPVNITDRAQVIQGVREAVLNGARGIMLVRGGGDPAGMQMWNDHRLVKELLDFGVPIYVALGHHKDRFLMDQVAGHPHRCWECPLQGPGGQTLRQQKTEIRAETGLADAVALGRGVGFGGGSCHQSAVQLKQFTWIRTKREPDALSPVPFWSRSGRLYRHVLVALKI